MVGDLKNGRTTHSLAKLLTNYKVTLNYVSPENLRMPESIRNYVKERSGIVQNEYTELNDKLLAQTDVIYMTRIQKERFESEEEYQKSCGKFIITPQLMNKAKSQNMIVMHPLPRNDEIQ
jgi:carbamoyl-phosphate synthase/aspartate carbamoyltransferase/dihydroorotase